MSPDLRLAGYADREAERVVATLFDWLRIPSISAHPQHAGDVRASAKFCARMLRDAGMEHVVLLGPPVPDGSDAAAGPAVYGDWLHAGPDAPTVLVYGHHDVQPVDPLELWTSPPFEPVIVDGECRARGSVDDKGQVLYQIEAARALLASDGRLPVNLKFIIEGEEEIGSPHFEALLVREAKRLRCDVLVVSDTGMIAPEVPSITVGMRGLVAFDVDLTTSTTDLHSGLWGGTVPNAAHVAAALVTALHDDAGRVTLPHFYDRVRPLSASEAASLARQPFDEAEFMGQAGVAALVGEAGYSPIERTTVRPTAEVVGISSGYQGSGIKTVVPATANFKVTFRLVPDQEPEAIAASFGEWLDAHLPAGVAARVTPVGGVAPALTPVEHPAVGALVRAIERVWGTAPLFTRSGGSGPEEALGRVLGAPLLFLGVSLPDDRFHAPNERLVMRQFWRGLLAAGELLVELGA
jgi:acetylornithine deacetylase/succinyl-diaminopimelate desuccinylase-like protein